VVVADTHVLVWLLSGDVRIGKRARARLEKALTREEFCVSALTFWEIAMLASRDRLRLGTTAIHFRWRVLEMGIRELALGGEVALVAATLAPVLIDPVDCVVAATALAYGAAVMTADVRLLESGAVDVVDARR
jgi:PIN domain nuclease of toxin-antitoxin system